MAGMGMDAGELNHGGHFLRSMVGHRWPAVNRAAPRVLAAHPTWCDHPQA